MISPIELERHYCKVEAGGESVDDEGGGSAEGAGLCGLAKRESSIGGSVSIFSAVRVCLISVPGLPWSIRNGYFSPSTSWNSEKKDSPGRFLSPGLRIPSHFKSKKEEASKRSKRI